MEDKAEGENELQRAPSTVVAIGIKGSKKSKSILQWALKRFVPEGRIMFKLIHVHASIKGVPTPSKHMSFCFSCFCYLQGLFDALEIYSVD